MNKKFQYNQAEPARGPWYFWSDYADPSVPAIGFNPKKAIKLLQSAGWKDKDKNGVLEKTVQDKKKSWLLLSSFPTPTVKNILPCIRRI